MTDDERIAALRLPGRNSLSRSLDSFLDRFLTYERIETVEGPADAKRTRNSASKLNTANTSRETDDEFADAVDSERGREVNLIDFFPT